MDSIAETPEDSGKLKVLLIIVFVILALAGLGVGLYFLLRPIEEECTCTINTTGCTCCVGCPIDGVPPATPGCNCTITTVGCTCCVGCPPEGVPPATPGCNCTITTVGCTCCVGCPVDGVQPPTCPLPAYPFATDATVNALRLADFEAMTNECVTVYIMGTAVISYPFTGQYIGINTYPDVDEKWLLDYWYDGGYHGFRFSAEFPSPNRPTWTLSGNRLTPSRQDNGNQLVAGIYRALYPSSALLLQQSVAIGTLLRAGNDGSELSYYNDQDTEDVILNCIFDGYNIFFYTDYNVILLRPVRFYQNYTIYCESVVCPVSWIGNPDLIPAVQDVYAAPYKRYFYLTTNTNV